MARRNKAFQEEGNYLKDKISLKISELMDLQNELVEVNKKHLLKYINNLLKRKKVYYWFTYEAEVEDVFEISNTGNRYYIDIKLKSGSTFTVEYDCLYVKDKYGNHSPMNQLISPFTNCCF